jgi:hypothetical protein
LCELQAAHDELVAETDGEITEAVEDVESAIAEMGDSLLEALCWMDREAMATIGAARNEEERLAEVRRRAESRRRWVRERVLEELARRGVASATAGTFTAQRKTGARRVEGDGVPELLPERFRRVKVEPNKAELARALKSGEKIDGWRLVAGPETVVIR